MSNQPKAVPVNEPTYTCGAIIPRHSLCPHCEKVFFGRAPSHHFFYVTTFKQKGTGFTYAGRIPMRDCPGCGMAMQVITEAIPVNLGSLRCEEGHSDFIVGVESLEANKEKHPTEWIFRVNITCETCKRLGKRQTKRQAIAEFFRIKKITVVWPFKFVVEWDARPKSWPVKARPISPKEANGVLMPEDGKPETNMRRGRRKVTAA